jgi:predicted nucleotidyltransferase component of viral defense system
MVNYIIMVVLPIDKKLKKRVHKNIALAQDILVMEIYNNFPAAVIHGGTALWRCYGSNRFSEDVDLYLPLAIKEKGLEEFLDNLRSKGFTVEKFKRTNNSIFAKFFYLDSVIRFEAVFKNIKNFVTKHFEMSDGTFILVNTLKPGDMIIEKISAYTKRRKVRDFYDIFFLLRFVEEKGEIKKPLARLAGEFKKPEDEKELKTLIISGSIPTFEKMLEEVKAWAR